MGYIARQWQNKLDYKKSTILLFAFFMISYIEFTALRKGLHIESLSAFTISTFPLAIFTLLTFAHYEKFIKNNLHLQMGGGEIGEKCSTDIYLWHPIIGNLTITYLVMCKPILAPIIYLFCIIISHIIIFIKSNASISR